MNHSYNLKNYNYYITISTLAILYILSGKASLFLLKSTFISHMAIFPPSGIALAFALYFGKNIWPGIFLGELTISLQNDILLIPSLQLSIICSLEAIIGVMLFKKYNLNTDLKKTRDVVGLAIIILFILQFFTSVFSNLALILGSQIESKQFLHSILSWWFGNSMGELLFTPFVLLLFLNFKKIKLLHYISYGIFFSIFLYFIYIVFPIKNLLLILILTIPIVIFVVRKKGIDYGLLSNILIASITAYSIYLKVNLHNDISDFKSIVDFNLFVLVYIVTVFTVNILFEQGNESEKILHKKIKKELEKNREQQLFMIQQSRLAQMGEMIAMIAHQWRQPLNNLALTNQLLISKFKKNKLDKKAIDYFKENSKKQINLMSTTIDDFRNFFKTAKQKELFCVNHVVENILDMTKAIYSTNGIVINFKATKLYYFHGYPNDLAQAILNIINNAKDALLQSKKKERNIDIDIKKINNKITISISDNAGGISENIIDKIFDPYFTTKDDKSGTGLGLYITKIVIERKMHSKIVVENDNFGAKFKIYLEGEEGGAK